MAGASARTRRASWTPFIPGIARSVISRWNGCPSIIRRAASPLSAAATSKPSAATTAAATFLTSIPDVRIAVDDRNPSGRPAVAGGGTRSYAVRLMPRARQVDGDDRALAVAALAPGGADRLPAEAVELGETETRTLAELLGGE